jgi:hypothetical protein
LLTTGLFKKEGSVKGGEREEKCLEILLNEFWVIFQMTGLPYYALYITTYIMLYMEQECRGIGEALSANSSGSFSFFFSFYQHWGLNSGLPSC